MKKILLTCFMLVFVLHAWAQDRTVSGKVTDAETGESLPGVNVLLKGTSTGVNTDLDGNYKISVPSDGGTLVFSFIGMAKQEIAIGSKSVIDVQLRPDIKQLGEVVVNALGMEKQRDRIGSASSPIDGDQIARSPETDLINSLSAKASGVNITRSSGDPGAGSYIQIRGQSTITGNLQPLIIVDGVPVSNSTLGNGTGNDGGVVQQSRLNDINPNDIANVEILKGASAAAIWGTRAANGVIMITTKSGSSKKGKVNVSINSNYNVDQLYIAHNTSEVWGPGVGMRYQLVPTGGLSWGDYIPDRSGGTDDYITDPNDPLYRGVFEAADGTQFYNIASGTAADPHGGKNSRETFDYKDYLFKTGSSFDNTVSVSGGDSESNFYISLGNMSQDGIGRFNSDYDRTTARVNATQRFSDKLKLSVKSTYARIESNRIQMGSNLSGLYLGGLRTTPDFNSNYYEGTYTNAAGLSFTDRQRSYRNPLGANTNSVYDNPLWSMQNNTSTTQVDRFVGSVDADISLAEGFILTGRLGVDHYSDQREDFFGVLSAGTNNGGRFDRQTIRETQINSDVFLNVNKNLSSSITLDAIVGLNFNERLFDNTFGRVRNFIITENVPKDLGNGPTVDQTAANGFSRIRTGATYLSATFGIADQLYATLTGRGETASAFGRDGQNTFYYPSADVAWQFTQMLGESDLLSFGKLRVAYGEVGVQPSPYNTVTYYGVGGYAESYGSALSANAGSYGGGYTESTVLGNSELKPERKKEIEFGTDLRFFNNKVGLSATYFQNNTVDAILSVATAPSTGFSSKTGNAAEIENKGIEIDLGAEILSVGDFSWRVDGNWTRIRNKVVSLAGTESLFLSGFTGTSSRAVEGEPLGVLWGIGYDRDESGNLVLDENGYPVAAGQEGILGDPNPDWKSGLSTTLSFKGLQLFVLGEFTYGGDIWGGTNGVLKYFGRHASQDGTVNISAADAADIPVWSGGTVATNYTPNDDGSFTVRGELDDFGDGTVILDEAWYRGLGGGFGAQSEDFIFDATNFRIREVRLSYSIVSDVLKSASIKSIDLSVSGRNLLIVGPDVEEIGNDPETNLTGTSNGRGLDYFNNPATRSYGFSVGINF